MAGLVLAIHVFLAASPSRRGCPAQGRAGRRRERGMTSARSTLFASIRRSLGVTGEEPARRAAVTERIATHPRGVIPARGQLPPQERVKLFAQMVEAASGTAEMLPSAANVPAAVAAFLRAHNL